VTTVFRNPKQEPAATDMPVISFFEMEDTVVKQTMRGNYPIYQREVDVITEVFLQPSSEGSATSELMSFLDEVRKKVFEGGVNLHRSCSEITETKMSRVLRPPTGDFVVGAALFFRVVYVDNVAALFT
jgi:hypothetical protein